MVERKLNKRLHLCEYSTERIAQIIKEDIPDWTVRDEKEFVEIVKSTANTDIDDFINSHDVSSILSNISTDDLFDALETRNVDFYVKK